MEFYDLLHDAFHNALKNISQYDFNLRNDFILSRDTIVKSRTPIKNYVSFIIKVFKDDYSIMKDIFCGVFENNIISKKKVMLF